MAERTRNDKLGNDVSRKIPSLITRTRLVIAESYNHFLTYCHESKLDHNDKLIHYVSGQRGIHGHHDVDIVFVEDWWRRRDSKELRQSLKAIPESNIYYWKDQRRRMSGFDRRWYD